MKPRMVPEEYYSPRVIFLGLFFRTKNVSPDFFYSPLIDFVFPPIWNAITYMTLESRGKKFEIPLRFLDEFPKAQFPV